MSWRISRGWGGLGVALAAVGVGLLWIGLDGLLGLLHDARAAQHCTTPGNPDCLPIPGEDSAYRDVTLVGAFVLAGAGFALGRGSRRSDARTS